MYRTCRLLNEWLVLYYCYKLLYAMPAARLQQPSAPMISRQYRYTHLPLHCSQKAVFGFPRDRGPTNLFCEQEFAKRIHHTCAQRPPDTPSLLACCDSTVLMLSHPLLLYF